MNEIQLHIGLAERPGTYFPGNLIGTTYLPVSWLARVKNLQLRVGILELRWSASGRRPQRCTHPLGPQIVIKES